MFQKKFVHWLSASFLIFNSPLLHADQETPRKALTRAIEKGDLTEVQSLIDSFAIGVDELSTDYDPKSPLIEAASQGKVSIMKYLIEKGACVDGVSRQGHSPLQKLIAVGSRVPSQELLATVRLLIHSGADVNGSGIDRYTPLMASCQHARCLELTEILLNEGALIDAQTTDGRTAYLVALRNNNVKAYRLLVNRGANTNVNWNGMRPLGALAWDGNIMMAKMLIEETGADVNAYGPNGATPLICAAFGGQASMIQFLLEKGANINATTNGVVNLEIRKEIFSPFKTYVSFPAGSTALNFVKTMGNDGVANFIINLGGILYQEVEYKEQTARYW